MVRRQLAEREPLEELSPEARAEIVSEAPPEELVMEVEALADATADLGRKSGGRG